MLQPVKTYRMKVFCYHFIKYAASAALISNCTLAICQVQPEPSLTNDLNRLENNIKQKQTLVEARAELSAIYNQAANSGNYTLQARSLNYLIIVRDQLTEDSLYFRNSAVVDSLIKAPETSANLRSILYVMQARRISRFNQLPRKFNAAAYRLKNISNNYAALNAEQRYALAGKYLDTALMGTKIAKNEAGQLKWLSGTPDVFLFEPGFEDIVLAEKVNLASQNIQFADPRVGLVDLLTLPSNAFILKLDSLASVKLNGGKIDVLNAYRNWMAVHKNNESTRAFIESIARKSIYLSFESDTLAYSAYTSYLLNSVNSQYDAVRAHAVYQLCLLWNQEGNKYKDFSDKGEYFYAGSLQPFNPQYQYLPAKALQLYQQHSTLLNKYPAFKQILDIMAKQMQASALRVNMEDTHMPDKDIPLRVTYKNTDTLYYQVIKISANETKTKITTGVKNLLQRSAALSGAFALPLPADNNVHATYLKLGKLPMGCYSLLFSHKPIKSDNDTLNSLDFNITNIIALNTDERVFVLSRKTGYPLAGARVNAFYNKKPLGKGFKSVVPASGYISFNPELADSLSISFKGDTLGYIINKVREQIDKNIFDKEEYDDLEEFYDDKVSMQIFTDRSIYRPGQTVNYKIILLTKHPKTGETILFNKQNLGGGVFKTRMKKWLNDDQNSLIELRDAFNKKTDSARLKINEFGSFAGSFILPKAAATGRWNIDGEPETNYNNDGSFEVEEYKRPTIELSMEKQKRTFLPGEQFAVKLKLRSFNGSDLNNVSVKYSISRFGSIPVKGKQDNYRLQYAQTRIIDTTGHTNAQGELIIAVSDTALKKLLLNDAQAWSFDYSVEAHAVDMTGESADLNEPVQAHSRPFNIHINLSGQVERQALPELTVRTSDNFAGNVPRMVNLKIYKSNKPEQKATQKKVDQWYYNENEWNIWFPAEEVLQIPVQRQIVFDTLINTADVKKIRLDAKRFAAGFYELEANTRDGEHTMGQRSQTFNVFDSKTGEWAGNEVNHVPLNLLNPGEAANWFGSGRSDNFTIYRSSYTNKGKKLITRYVAVTEKAGVRKWNYVIPADAADQILLTRISVYNNQITQSEQRIYVRKEDKLNPQIVVERYRRVMGPGAEEKFSVSIKTKNDNVAAELLTTLYDASLDKLYPHNWLLPQTDNYRFYLNTNWNRSIADEISAEFRSADLNPVNLFNISAQDRENGIFYALEGGVAGVNVTSARGLEEVVVTAYGSVRKNYLTGSLSSITIRGRSSIDDILKKIPGLEVDAAGNVITFGRSVTNVRLSGKDYVGGDLNNLARNLPADILDKFQVVNDYGDQANLTGVKDSTEGKILSFTLNADGTKINILMEPPAPAIKIRKNFNETAFFFPQVHADNSGLYTFSFTMPETATEWNWKMLAHTRDARFAYLEKKLQTQLNLMVQPKMPRLLYQGDKIKLQSRVSNLDTMAIQGKATLKIEDAVTGADITRILANNKEIPFSLDKKSSGSVAFTLNVPATQTNPLKIVVTITGGGAADAEEHIIPVLSSKILIRQSVPVRFGDNTAITIKKPKLPGDAISYGLGISINQQSQASLLYALPWLAAYSFDCAEQTFNKLRAQATAVKLMQKDTSVQSAFKSAKAFMEHEQPKAEGMPDEMAAATMPWLGLNTNTATQQKQMFRLLDTLQTKAGIDKHLRRLYSLQKPDGGLSWFEGGESNAYISAYVLAGFGQLKRSNWAAGNSMLYQQNPFIDKLNRYVQTGLTDSTAQLNRSYLLYALSYWQTEHPLSPKQLINANKILEQEWTNVNVKNLQQKALLVINTVRYLPVANSLSDKAYNLLESIRQMAIQDDLNGIRWKAIADAENMNNAAEETMALLCEAFEISEKYKDVQRGMIKWLLSAKQHQHWQTTKATAAAIDMLQKENGVMATVKSFSADVAGKQLNVSDGLLNGKPEDFFTEEESPASVTLKQTGTNTTGAVTWYYFAKPEGLDTLSNTVKINKQFFVYGAGGETKPTIPAAVFKPGDRLQVKITIDAATPLQYVHINDPRAALFEPENNISGYRYAKRIGYYQSVRDTGLELFFEDIPRGVTEFTYDVVVAQSGEFSSGPATLQCMYQPGFTAYSNTGVFKSE